MKRLRLILDKEVARIYPAENKIVDRTDSVPYRKLHYEKATSGLKSSGATSEATSIFNNSSGATKSLEQDILTKLELANKN